MNSPLHHVHQNHNAKFIQFGDWKLPCWFSTIKNEHCSVRENAGLFDISHMGLLHISGPNVMNQIQRLSCNGISGIKQKKMIYSMILSDEGTILDDVMIGSFGTDIIMIVNANNTQKIIDWITKKTHDLTINYLNDSHGFIAIQGPKALSKLETLFPSISTLCPRFHTITQPYKDQEIHIYRTGYTGEDGAELMIPKSCIESIWDALIKTDVTLCGLGARDTLRIEAGLPLYGQELSESITPLETRYQWVVGKNHDFIGKDALESRPIRYKTIGIKMQESCIARPGNKVGDGHITSGTLSPYTNQSIAMALVPANNIIKSELTVNIRKKDVVGTVTPIPFI